MFKILSQPKRKFFSPASTIVFGVFHCTRKVCDHCLNLFLKRTELINKIAIDIRIGSKVNPQLINPLNKYDCIALTIIEIGNTDNIWLIDDGKKLRSMIKPLPNKVKKSKIINDRRKVADLSESIDMVIKMFPKTKMKINK